MSCYIIHSKKRHTEAMHYPYLSLPTINHVKDLWMVTTRVNRDFLCDLFFMRNVNDITGYIMWYNNKYNMVQTIKKTLNINNTHTQNKFWRIQILFWSIFWYYDDVEFNINVFEKYFNKTRTKSYNTRFGKLARN